MKTLLPIGIISQLEDVLLGCPEGQGRAVASKIEYVRTNIHRVDTINGSKVYNPAVIDNRIWYNLAKTDEQIVKMFKLTDENINREYYYPIQYALITLK